MTTGRRSISTRMLVAVGLVAALLLGGVVSQFASDSPDGLNHVAGDQGFADRQQPSSVSAGPLAGYETRGVDHIGVSGGLAGLVGCLVVLALTTGTAVVVRRNKAAAQAAD
jgi:cobalt/nickel transport protein